MSEEVKYMGATKKEIWEAYKRIKTELNSLQEDQPTTTTEKALKENIKKSIKNAEAIPTGYIEEILLKFIEEIKNCKAQYDLLTTAIEAKKKELQEVHAIEISANDLAALAKTKEDITTESNRIKEEADNYYTEQMKKTTEDIEALKTEKEKEHKREDEEYKYNMNRLRIMEKNELEDELKIKSKSLDERALSIEKREKLAEEKDKKTEELQQKVIELENNLNKKTDEAFELGKEKAEKSAKFTANMVKAHTDAEAKIAQATIDSLNGKIIEMEKQIKTANNMVIQANEQVSNLAQSALKVQGDAATISEVSKIAAGAQKK